MELVEGAATQHIIVWAADQSAMELVEGAAAQHIIVWAADQSATESIEWQLPHR